MFRVALQGLLSHKLRVLLSSLSIALGVAFVTGTLVLTDGMNAAFTDGYKQQYTGTDVVVRAPAAFEDTDALDQRGPVPASTLGSVTATSGVAEAEGSVTGWSLITDKQGKAITREGASTQATSAHKVTALAGNTKLASGRMPVDASETAIDAATVKSAGFKLGEPVHVVFRTGQQAFTLVGTVKFGHEDSFAGNTTAFFDTDTAQRALGKIGQYDEIRATGDPGVSQRALQSAVAKSLPRGAEAVTGASAANEAAKTVKDSFSFVNALLLVFAAIAIFVGSFIIWNTFSILVAQRSRELALLRAVGATRKQVRRSVVFESLLVGAVASVVGIAAGVALSLGLKSLLTAFGLDLPSTTLTLHPRTIIVGMLVGIVVTLVAALSPARRATRIPPVAALRDTGPPQWRASKTRFFTSFGVLVLGLLVLSAGLFAGSGALLVGVGVLITFIGVTAMFPLIARPASRWLGAPLAAFRGSTGVIAQENAMRNPKRTASTAAALMIGLSLVAAMGVLAASLKASINKDVDKTGRAELILSDAGNNATLSPAAAEAIRHQPGVAAVSELGYGSAKVDGTRHYVTPIDPATIDKVLDIGIKKGTVAALTDRGVLVYDQVAKTKNYKIGDRLKFQWAQSGQESLIVVGTYSEKGAAGSDYLVTFGTFDRHTAQRLDSLIFVKKAPGTSVSALKSTVSSAVASYPNIRVDTLKEFKHDFAAQVNKFLALIVVLLALAVIIALLGIVNTLALSVFERTRELGLLRAVGMTREQVRAMVRYESVIISVLGAIMGVLVGVVFGLALVKALRGQGIHSTAVPVLQLVLYVVGAAVAGVLAAIGPARRAANVDVLKAVVTE
ncbi:MAG: ABC transporter permease [Actinomycetes bacterium]